MAAVNMMVDGVPMGEFVAQGENIGSAHDVDEYELPF